MGVPGRPGRPGRSSRLTAGRGRAGDGRGPRTLADRFERAAAELAARARTVAADPAVRPVVDVEVPFSTLPAIELGEALVLGEHAVTHGLRGLRSPGSRLP